MAVVTSVPAVGTLQSVALIVAPAASARLWSSRVLPMTVLAVGFGVTGGVTGVLLSRAVNVAAGGAIVLVLATIFLLSLVLSTWSTARRRRPVSPPDGDGQPSGGGPGLTAVGRRRRCVPWPPAG